MALRDIFDRDPRSKEQLREELRIHEKVISDLSQRLNEVESRSTAAELTVSELRNQIEIAKTQGTSLAHLSTTFLPNSVIALPAGRRNDEVDHTDSDFIKLGAQPADLSATSAFGAQPEVTPRPTNSVMSEAEQVQLLQIQNELSASERIRAILLIANALHRRLTAMQLADIVETQLRVAQLQTQSTQLVGPRVPDLTGDPATIVNTATLQKVEEQLAEALDRLEHANIRLEQQKSMQARLDAVEIENAALKKGVGPEVWGLRREVEQCNQKIATLQYQLDLGTLNYNAKVKEFDERSLQSKQEHVRQKRLVTEMDETIDSLTESVEDLESDNQTLQAAIVALEAEASDAASRLQFQINKNQNLSAELAQFKQRVVTERTASAIVAGAIDRVFRREEILGWMFSETLPEDLQVDHAYLHLMGDGPWGNAIFSRLMEGQKFDLRPLPDPDIAHLVVGRINWSKDDLLAQIEARHGQELRIYSQEMWFAAMATGRDPFDAEDPALLQAFAKGHEALEFLIGQEFPWPDVSDHEADGEVVPPGPGDLGVLESPMHLMDYRVGKTSPHAEETRHAILDEIFCSRNLPFGEDCTTAYRASWGKPKSAQRLYRMATHIKFIVDGPSGKDPRRPVAREDWIKDLAWLKRTYFNKTAHAFKWPSTQVI